MRNSENISLLHSAPCDNNYIAELKRHVSVMIKNLNYDSCKKKTGLLRVYAKAAEKPGE